jgi:NADH-quinone oxidoreductase subunit M
VILAGVLLKMGTYGFIRFAFPLFPEAAAYFAPWIRRAGRDRIIYGALVAMVQPDMKKLVAYSSVSHSRVRRPRHLRDERAGDAGRGVPDAGPRRVDGGLFLIVGMLSIGGTRVSSVSSAV